MKAILKAVIPTFVGLCFRAEFFCAVLLCDCLLVRQRKILMAKKKKERRAVRMNQSFNICIQNFLNNIFQTIC